MLRPAASVPAGSAPAAPLRYKECTWRNWRRVDVIRALPNVARTISPVRAAFFMDWLQEPLGRFQTYLRHGLEVPLMPSLQTLSDVNGLCDARRRFVFTCTRPSRS